MRTSLGPTLQRERQDRDTRPEAPPRPTAEEASHGDAVEAGQNDGVTLARAAWLVTVTGFILAALLLLLNGYFGYFLVLLSVACAAGVNLLR